MMKMKKGMKGKKKSYVVPEVKTVRLEATQLMASSVSDSKDFHNGGYYGRESEPWSIWD